jgi:uncharacterized protein YegL
VTAPVSLILNVSPVQRGITPRATTPDVAVVYATAGGRLGFFDGRPMTWKEQLTSAYRTRYDVDISDHRRRGHMVSTPLPSRGDYYFFIATVDIGFRVHDPQEVVRKHITDPLHVVYGHLADRFRPITRLFDIEDSEHAENAIVDNLRGETILPEGITIFHVSPRLLPDEKASNYLQQKQDAERRLLMNRAEHEVALEEAEHRGQLASMDKEFQLQQMKRELEELEGHNLDAVEIIRLHLARNPGDTEKAMELLAEHRQSLLRHQDLYNERSTTLFKLMVDKGLIQAADVEPLLAQTLGQIGIVPPPPPIEVRAELAPDWSEPSVIQPPAAPEATATAEEPAEDAEIVDENRRHRWTPGAGIRPVYILIDESAEASDQLDALDAGVSALLRTLKRADEIAEVIRLAVLGYADHLTVRLPLSKVDGSTSVPHLRGGGPASYAAMFNTLAARIDQDIESLEAETLEIRQPIVFLLSASPAGDNWTNPLRRLVDIHLHAHPPTIVACGIGSAPADMIAQIATEPGQGFVPDAGTDPTDAIVQYWQFVVRDVLDLGRDVLDGRDEAIIEPPDGFRIAGEAA